MEQHKFYRHAYAAYRNMSYTPEDRAKRTLEWYDAVLKEFVDAGKDWAVEKFTALYLKHLAAESRCASAMIVGPARFPVERNRKRMDMAMKRWEEVAAFLEKVRRPPVEPRTELDYGIQEKEYQIGEVTVKQNTEQNRLQLIFPGKPEAAMIETLKKNGFKWSPRNTAWQRQLTPNALATVKKQLEKSPVTKTNTHTTKED